jgi:hypothetical protein
MHTLGLALVFFATFQSNAPEERMLRVFTNAAPREPIMRFEIVPQQPRPRFAPPDRHESANERRYFVCPRDGAVLHVPDTAAGDTFKCPVDGTEMKGGVGTGRKFFLLNE